MYGKCSASRCHTKHIGGHEAVLTGSIHDATATAHAIQRYDRLFESLPDAMVAVTRENRIVHTNTLFERLFGYTDAEVIGKSIEFLVPARFRARHRRHVADFMTHPRARPMGSGLDLFGLKKNGEEFPVDISLGYVTIGEDTVVLAAIRDITERKTAERKTNLSLRIQKAISEVLKISLEPSSLEEQLARVLDLILSIPGFSFRSRASIYLVEEDSDTLSLQAVRGFSSVQMDQCKSVTLSEEVTDNKEEACQIIPGDWSTGRSGIDFLELGPYGQYSAPIVFGGKAIGLINIAVMNKLSRVPEEEEFLASIANSLAGLVERHRAETERKRLRDQLHENEILAALGRITANVSHTIKNPLTAIGGFANKLMDSLREGTKEKKYAGMIFSEAVRLENVLQNVLLFSRRDADQHVKCDVPALIDKALSMYEDICIDRRIIIDRKLSKVPNILANREQLLVAIENLLSNAVDSMRDGGTLSVRTDAEEVGASRYVAVRVGDTGYGISKENINRIFEPFFTTKLIMKGTGLGLSITNKVVDEHGGFIRVESHPGKGAVFSMYFPVAGK